MPDLYENQTFEDQTIQLDENEYANCKFRRCRLQYGGAAVRLKDNDFSQCTWEFTNAAERTVKFMMALYHQGGRKLIEQTFENIRQGRLAHS